MFTTASPSPTGATTSLSHSAFVHTTRRAAAAWFDARDLPCRSEHPHILAPPVTWHDNLLLHEVRADVEAELFDAAQSRSPFALNGQNHYGTSSQTMLFNLVGPLIVCNDLAPFAEACADAGIPWSRPSTV